MHAHRQTYRSLTLLLSLAAALIPSLHTGAERAVRVPLPAGDVIAALPEDGGEEFNRLIFEHSPYLLQHARNPVDWFPWGDAAFEKAGEEGKLVFLSVGYSTCHWCHVMEHESFEDEEVAALMNAGFVPIKVDREERPDIDEIYMAVTQAMTGSGGWPMTVILTPDRKPVFAGTYFPKEGKFGRPGMMELLPKLTSAYKEDPEKFANAGEGITTFLKEKAGGEAGDVDPEALLTQAYRQHEDMFDAEHGGFGAAPKFPTPHRLMYLLRYWKRTGKAEALAMVEKTLTEMRLGGMYDHVGHGFHRYSVDAEWLVPHFEKMLYDQALLAMAYTEAYQATGNRFYANTAREILGYVLRDMTSPEGGFHSAEDADSEGEEGKFYVWTEAEIMDVLGEADGNFYTEYLNIQADGNWPEGKEHKTNIPHMSKVIGPGGGAVRKQLESCRQKLFLAREERIHPYKDDKILTDWNGLMIAALAKASRALDSEEHRAAAVKAADFLLATIQTKEGRLLHRYRNGSAGLPAQLEDYTFLVWGLIELYETTFDEKYLESAIALNKTMTEHYWDKKDRGYFMTADDAEALIMRPKSVYDGAIPSGNSAAVYNLLRLSRMTGDTVLEERASATAEAFGETLSGGPSSFALMLIGLDFAAGPSYEVVVAGDRDGADTHAMLKALHKPFIPNKVVLLRPESDAKPRISEIASYTETQKSLDGEATAYVCSNFVCSFPTTNLEKMLSLMGKKK
jgi:uncharacterized protein